MDTLHYVYIICCSDKSLYTGYTNRLHERVATHNAGKGGKYTRGRTPVTLVYYEEFMEKSTAMRREYEIKQLSRAQKEQLVATLALH